MRNRGFLLAHGAAAQRGHVETLRRRLRSEPAAVRSAEKQREPFGARSRKCPGPFRFPAGPSSIFDSQLSQASFGSPLDPLIAPPAPVTKHQVDLLQLTMGPASTKPSPILQHKLQASFKTKTFSAAGLRRSWRSSDCDAGGTQGVA